MILKIAVSCTVKVSMGVLFTLCSLKVTWMPLLKNVSYFSFLLEYKIKVLENISASNVSLDLQVCAFHGNQPYTRNG